LATVKNAYESLYGGQFALSTQLIKPNYQYLTKSLPSFNFYHRTPGNEPLSRPNYLIRSAVSVDSQLRFGVPLGSVLGPVLFSMFVAPVEDIFLSHGLRPMFYADDSQIYLTMGLRNRNVSIGKIEDCISHIIGWYSNNFLLCNPAKTKVIYFSSKFIDKDPIPSINIGANTIKLESAICDLGVVLDNHLDLSRQVNNICKSASLAIHNIGKIRKYLDQPTAEKLIHAFVTTILDFCNSLLFGLPKKQIDKLQRI